MSESRRSSKRDDQFLGDLSCNARVAARPTFAGASRSSEKRSPPCCGNPAAHFRALDLGSAVCWSLVSASPSREAVIERFKRCPPPTDLRQGRSRSARSTTPVMRAREEKWIAEQQAKPSRA